MPLDTEHKVEFPILFVEDEVGIRKRIAKMLGRFFNRVLEAENGQEGLDIFQEVRPPIVVTDIQMPVMSGLEMAREIKLSAPDTLVIILSAYSDPEYMEAAKKIGIDHYLVKPVSMTHMFEAIEQYIDQTK